MSDESLPKFFKDAQGFCYSATRLLAKLAHLSPWDGDVDDKGFAVTPKPARSQDKPPKAAE